MKRTTYNLVVFAEDLMERGLSPKSFTQELSELLTRSGGCNVTNSLLVVERVEELRLVGYGVVFGSAGWTGGEG